jgi:hypothetical protein
MKDRINKPRLFLSHSKKDDIFIKRLCDDLRTCQIDPWLDVYEIRHGQPWLDAIFEDGISTCDAVLVYLSEHSIISPVVKKEIDAAIIQKLRDNQVAFLPYVTDSALRLQLRADLQAIQAPEWNDDNYSKLLPMVVAEVWHSYLERAVVRAIQKEKIVRLEAELHIQELEKQRDAGVFSVSEARDFENIWKRVDRFEPVVYSLLKPVDKSFCEIGSYAFEVHIGSLLPAISKASEYEYFGINQILQSQVPKELPVKANDERINLISKLEIGNELLMYGFLSRFNKNTSSTGPVSSFTFITDRYGLMYTDKLERFKYWMALKGNLADEVRWRPKQSSPSPSVSDTQSHQD